jgi:Uma2 family endonuclease
MSALPEQFVSLEDYFTLEETGEIRHEYYRGSIFAMTGGSERHNLISLDVGTELNLQLRGSSCRAYGTDFRLKIEASGLYTYPDLSVICGDTQTVDKRHDTYRNPIVLIEVLSESTKDYDRGQKFEFYRTIPTLQAYLVIAQDRPHVELFRRQHDGWFMTEYQALDAVVPLDAIRCTLPLSAIYARVTFEGA